MRLVHYIIWAPSRSSKVVQEHAFPAECGSRFTAFEAVHDTLHCLAP